MSGYSKEEWFGLEDIEDQFDVEAASPKPDGVASSCAQPGCDGCYRAVHVTGAARDFECTACGHVVHSTFAEFGQREDDDDVLAAAQGGAWVFQRGQTGYRFAKHKEYGLPAGELDRRLSAMHTRMHILCAGLQCKEEVELAALSVLKGEVRKKERSELQGRLRSAKLEWDQWGLTVGVNCAAALFVASHRRRAGLTVDELARVVCPAEEGEEQGVVEAARVYVCRQIRTLARAFEGWAELEEGAGQGGARATLDAAFGGRLRALLGARQSGAATKEALVARLAAAAAAAADEATAATSVDEEKLRRIRALTEVVARTAQEVSGDWSSELDEKLLPPACCVAAQHVDPVWQKHRVCRELETAVYGGFAAANAARAAHTAQVQLAGPVRYVKECLFALMLATSGTAFLLSGNTFEMHGHLAHCLRSIVGLRRRFHHMRGPREREEEVVAAAEEEEHQRPPDGNHCANGEPAGSLPAAKRPRCE